MGCAWSFWLLCVDFGFIGQLGCFKLLQSVLGLLLFALSCVLLFLRFLLAFILVRVVPSCSNLFSIVLNCFILFFVFEVAFGCSRLSSRLNCFGCSGDSVLFSVV